MDFSHDRPDRATDGARALDAITLSIAKGEFVTLLGNSGSGKSTLLKLCNALFLPTSGAVRVQGLDTRDAAQLREIRRMSGMIFQDPGSQIIGATVAEDVAFGPENLGLLPQDIRNRVNVALLTVGMVDHADSAIHFLSSAQKLRVALAGILAMRPACILFDDAAALLELAERREFMSLLRRVNRENGITVVQATRNSGEATTADRVIVLAKGKIVFAGEPAQLAGEDSRPAECSPELPAVDNLWEATGARIIC